MCSVHHHCVMSRVTRIPIANIHHKDEKPKYTSGIISILYSILCILYVCIVPIHNILYYTLYIDTMLRKTSNTGKT